MAQRLAKGLRGSLSSHYLVGMIELFRSNDPVVISFAQALLKDAGIEHATVDQHMSVMEGSIGILPRRVLVPRQDHESARRVLVEAGLERELS